ncbi:unnamed protein product [Dovyalis caffra]|uniref:GDSL esterase/lipase n=1 Tax=Dovyalis caffra TaxID=77055 RepID=A0AAV1SJ86_9ROSI|nr:unnamed protein product [Dovyalis caffra]
MGSNDYLNNYFQPEYYNTSKRYTLRDYSSVLMDQYFEQLMTLYNYGARKIAVFGLGRLGCAPRAIELYSTNGTVSCSSKLNLASSLFNRRLIRLTRRLNKDLDDAQFTYVNVSGIGEGDPAQLGFKVATSSCCKVREDGQCIPDEKPCANRSEYAFWDSFHPTEAANRVTAARAYSSYLPSDSEPFDIHHLVELDLGNQTKS